MKDKLQFSDQTQPWRNYEPHQETIKKSCIPQRHEFIKQAVTNKTNR